ncbi:MAG: transketolase, partial [Armatimonadota bacterium]
RADGPRSDIVNNTIYVIASDGDMMEGISHESCSLAGHLGLDNLVVLYDDNNITIEGNTCLAYTDDVKKRFESYNWYVQSIDGHDRDAIQKAIENAKAETSKPSLIICKTQIGKGAPNKENTSSAHGEPLGEEEIKAAKEAAGWPIEPTFYVPDEVYDIFKKRTESNISEYNAWNELLKKYFEEFPEEAKLWKAMMDKEVLANIEDIVIPKIDCAKANATRNSSGIIMQELAKLVPSLWGGSADLSPSTKTDIKGEESFCNNKYIGKNIHFGVREHGMGSAMNGIALYGGFIPYGSTFLIFSDYLRPVIRLASLMKQHVIYVFTHDSIFVGEDGPTHEPIEQIPSLRMINGVRVIRPADTAETAVAWAVALESKSPTALMLTRQNVPAISDNPMDAKQLRKGAYIVKDVDNPDTVIIATGSEVHISIEAAGILSQKGIKARVVSMPCTDLFDLQDEEYKNYIIPSSVTKRVVVEAAAPYGWHKYVGCGGLVIGMERFGASAPYKVLAEKFGFTPDQIAAKVEAYVKS